MHSGSEFAPLVSFSLHLSRSTHYFFYNYVGGFSVCFNYHLTLLGSRQSHLPHEKIKVIPYLRSVLASIACLSHDDVHVFHQPLPTHNSAFSKLKSSLSSESSICWLTKGPSVETC